MLIETTQGTGVWGVYDCPYCLTELDDLLTNTTGAVLGWFIGRWMAGRVRWPAPANVDRTGPDEESPSVGRRFVAVMLDVMAFGVVAGALQFDLALGARIIGVGNTPSDWPGPVVFVAGADRDAAASARRAWSTSHGEGATGEDGGALEPAATCVDGNVLGACVLPCRRLRAAGNGAPPSGSSPSRRARLGLPDRGQRGPRPGRRS